MRKGYFTRIQLGPGGFLLSACGSVAVIFISLCCFSLLTGCSESTPTTQATEDETPIEKRSSVPASRESVPEPTAAFVEPGSVPGRTHWVQKGETLYSISRLYYGTENQWRRIYYANDRRLRHPDEVPVGIKLIIP